jgi:hypothetical protein
MYHILSHNRVNSSGGNGVTGHSGSGKVASTVNLAVWVSILTRERLDDTASNTGFCMERVIKAKQHH